TGLVAVRHSANIGRLIHGTENRLRDSQAMFLFSRILHVVALGLWFGSVMFFLVTTAVLFRAFGSQTAGSTVAPLFDVYFPLQAACAVIVFITALAWVRVEPAARVHRIRVIVVMLALATVLIGWPVARYVGALRNDRISSDWDLAAQAETLFG